MAYRIKVDAERVVGRVNPVIYGHSSSTWAAASTGGSSMSAGTGGT